MAGTPPAQRLMWLVQKGFPFATKWLVLANSRIQQRVVTQVTERVYPLRPQLYSELKQERERGGQPSRESRLDHLRCVTAVTWDTPCIRSPRRSPLSTALHHIASTSTRY